MTNTANMPDEVADGFFARIALFIRQVIAELKLVVTPSRPELLKMTGVVLVFVLIIMLIVYAIDWVIRLGVFSLFG